VTQILEDPVGWGAIALTLASILGGVWLGLWIRRERRAFDSDVQDLYLSPAELDAKYGVNRNETPDDRSRDCVAGPENSLPPSRPPAAGEEH